MPAQPASATAASNRNDPIEIIMACEAGRISIGKVGGTGLEPVTPSLSIGPYVRVSSLPFAYRCKSALSFSWRSLRPHQSELSLRPLRPPIFAAFTAPSLVAKTLGAESTR